MNKFAPSKSKALLQQNTVLQWHRMTAWAVKDQADFIHPASTCSGASLISTCQVVIITLKQKHKSPSSSWLESSRGFLGWTCLTRLIMFWRINKGKLSKIAPPPNPYLHPPPAQWQWHFNLPNMCIHVTKKSFFKLNCINEWNLTTKVLMFSVSKLQFAKNRMRPLHEDLAELQRFLTHQQIMVVCLYNLVHLSSIALIQMDGFVIAETVSWNFYFGGFLHQQNINMFYKSEPQQWNLF